MDENKQTENDGKQSLSNRSLRTVKTNEDLNSYLRGNSRSVWMALGIIIVLIIALLVWANIASPLFLSSLLFGE